MAGLLYLIPERKPPFTAKDAAEVGIGYAFEGAITVCGTRAGPDGAGGIVVADDKTVPSVKYLPDVQTWRKVPGSVAWVGFYTDDPPKPEDLVRQVTLPGYVLELGDGNRWQVPVARAFGEVDGDPGCANILPTRTDMDGDGKWKEGAVLPRYVKLWEVAGAWWDVFRKTIEGDESPNAESTVGFEFSEKSDAAVAALSANYRIGGVEAAMLGLLTSQNTDAILYALIDWLTAQEWLAKKKSESECVDSNTGDGQPGDSPDTDQP